MRYVSRSLGVIVKRWGLLARRTGTLVLIALMCSNASYAYSVLTHEEIVDLLWTDDIRPLLLKRFPGLSEDQIKEAHAYAYGGAVIQDLGYYPFGSTEFSNLVHYVRSGDFVRELLLESQDVNEYAFALGALSHYAADIAGHPAVNQAVAIEYPKLRAKFGKSVRYAQDKTAHLKTEFGFDTLQVAKNRYASQQYHDFIGFQVSKSLLERAFPVVYGVELKDVLTHEDLAVGSYRFSVGRLIPQMTQVALQTHKKDLMRETPNFAKRKFLYRLSRSDYEREWGKDYVKPGVGTRILSTLLRYMPRIGPFKGLGFNNPTPQTEDLYIKSINATVDQYRAFLAEVRTSSLTLANADFDSGEPTKAAEYSLTDETYAKLLGQLSDRKFDRTSPELRANILEFYSDLSAPIETKKDNVHWQSVLKSLDQLKAAPPNVIDADDFAPRPARVPTMQTVRTAPTVIVIGFVGGFISHDNLVHSEAQLAARLRKDYPLGVYVETFESYHGAKARKKVLDLLDTNHDGTLTPEEKQNARIIIYGHSWGGSEAITLARELEGEGIPVLLTIQVDSISKVHQNDALIPANVAQAANFYQPNGLMHGQSEIRAADPARTNILGNFRFDYRASPYNCGEYPWYDRLFVKPHTQIECDPRVWKQAESLIRSDLPGAGTETQQ
jgi:Zinc dependent phospholipase C